MDQEAVGSKYDGVRFCVNSFAGPENSQSLQHSGTFHILGVETSIIQIEDTFVDS